MYATVCKKLLQIHPLVVNHTSTRLQIEAVAYLPLGHLGHAPPWTAKKSRVWQKNATKMRHFQAKISKIFWGRGTAPFWNPKYATVPIVSKRFTNSIVCEGIGQIIELVHVKHRSNYAFLLQFCVRAQWSWLCYWIFVYCVYNRLFYFHLLCYFIFYVILPCVHLYDFHVK